MELFVRTRKGVPRSFSASRNRSAPGIACCSCTSTPSMSISQVRISRDMTLSLDPPVAPRRDPCTLRGHGPRRPPAHDGMTLLLAILIGYLLGSIPWGWALPRWAAGVNIREHGSGNMGAANVGRILGLKWGVAVALLDIAKGTAAGVAGLLLAGDVGGVLAGAGAMAGHCRPLYLRFARGGKAVATGVGV